eukprot:536825-Pyramimonas_sp.AAC.1
MDTFLAGLLRRRDQARWHGSHPGLRVPMHGPLGREQRPATAWPGRLHPARRPRLLGARGRCLQG